MGLEDEDEDGDEDDEDELLVEGLSERFLLVSREDSRFSCLECWKDN